MLLSIHRHGHLIGLVGLELPHGAVVFLHLFARRHSHFGSYELCLLLALHIQEIEIPLLPTEPPRGGIVRMCGELRTVEGAEL
jgi:hypothetical protein